MKNIPLSFLFLILTLSCLQNKTTAPVNGKTTDRQEQEASSDESVKYITIRLFANGYSEDNPFGHTIEAELGRRPVMIAGNFTSVPGGDNSPQINCFFEFALSDSQSDEFEKLVHQIKFCDRDPENEKRNTDFIETSFMYMTDTDGKMDMAFKTDPGDLDAQWMCGGQDEFYKFLKTTVSPKVPKECPKGALSKF